MTDSKVCVPSPPTELCAESGTHFVLPQTTLHECTHTTWQACLGADSIIVCGQNDFHSPPHPPTHHRTGTGAGPGPCRGGWGGGRNPAAATWAPSVRSPHPLFPTRPRLRKPFLRVPAEGRRGSPEELFPFNPGGRRAREGRGGGGSAQGPVFAFISSDKRFYLWKRTDAED